MIVSVMRTSIIALKPSSTLREAAEFMLEKKTGLILIVDDRERLVEIADREDFIKAMLRSRMTILQPMQRKSPSELGFCEMREGPLNV